MKRSPYWYYSVTPTFLEEFYGDLSKMFYIPDVQTTTTTRTGRATVGCKCDKEACVFVVELPGVKKENISLTYEKGDIVLKAKKTHYYSDKEIEISENLVLVDPSLYCLDSITSKFEDGILTITVPKKEQEKPKEIAVT